MKALSLLAVSVLYVVLDSCCGAAIVPTTYDDLDSSDRSDMAYIRDYSRLKRSGSGSGDILQHLKTSIGQGIKSKLGMLARGSASASSHFSSGSSGYGHNYHYDHDVGHKQVDPWSLKKSIFHTLLQAVKAIKGGVIAIKGQLIKGSGHILSAKGKLITGGGEALSNLGRNIATSAFLVVPHEKEHDHPPVHQDYVSPIVIGHSAPEASYHSAPSAPGPDYGAPPTSHKQHFSSLYEGKSQHDGLVILKKIPDEHEGQETQTPDFKPLPPNNPQSNKGFFNNMFSASAPESFDYQQQQLPPSTSYGHPLGNSVKYEEYYNPQNTVSLKQQHKQTVNNKLPSIDQDQPIIFKLDIPKKPASINDNDNGNDDKAQIFIGMNVPLESLPYQSVGDFKGQGFVKPTPYENDVSSQFLINYPDPTYPTYKKPLFDSYPQASRHLPKRTPARFSKPHPQKQIRPHQHQQLPHSPNFEILRSMAFELGPRGAVKV